MKKRQRFMKKAILFSMLLSGSSFATASTFNINLNFTGGLTASQQSIFTQAKAFWENIITGYQQNIPLTGINIEASGQAIDGVYGILGQAGPTTAVKYGANGYWLANNGIMEFDSADLSAMETGGYLLDVIKHEMAHVMGFGTLWTWNGVYSSANPGQYTGAAALAAYKKEFDPLATYVPVELGGGAGTAHGHWNENNGGGLGHILTNELMTGWLNTPSFVSETTKASFIDIGYTIASASTPVPAAVFLFGSGLVGLLSFARKK